MKAFILDASVALRWFLDKTVHPYAARVKQLLLGGARARVPALWHLEMANAFVVAERRKVLGAGDIDHALQSLEQLISVAIDTDSTVVPIRRIWASARTLQLSAYDASYLDLAQNESLCLATLDDQLRAAAKHNGIDIV